jgi:hypothetical protein
VKLLQPSWNMSLRFVGTLLISLAAVSLSSGPGVAGMPSPLPSDPETYWRLSESVSFGLQSISLFAVLFIVCGLVLQWLWNYLQRGFPFLPRLTICRAMALVLLWGALFIVVLTMISGARELMTPGAWVKQGFTYKLDQSERYPLLSAEQKRRRHFEELRTALWQFAATHKGMFPREDETAAIAGDLWEIPGGGGLRYQFISGSSAGPEASLLAYEPDLGNRVRLVLKTNGDIIEMTTEQFAAVPLRESNE